MNRTRIAFCALVAAAPLMLAMGFMGDPPALEKAPEPDTRVDAIVQDSDGMTTRISYVSYDGELYLPVYRGKALITIPFANISRIQFGPKASHTRQVTIHFTDGREETFRMDNKVLFVGKLPFGTYQIQVKDLAEVTFLPPGGEAGDAAPAGTSDSRT